MNLCHRLMAWLCASIASVFLCLAAPADLTIVDAAHRRQDTDALISKIADKRVVFIGGDHERYDEHLEQCQTAVAGSGNCHSSACRQIG
jgi:hypothetical protein